MAKQFINRFLKMVRAYDLAAYDLLDDDAEISLTVRGMMTLRWTGRQYRKNIRPTVERAKKEGKKYKVKGLTFQNDGDDVIVRGSFEPCPTGLDGNFMARIGLRNMGWRFKEFHHGTPVKDFIRFEPEKRVEHPDGSMEWTLKPVKTGRKSKKH